MTRPVSRGPEQLVVMAWAGGWGEGLRRAVSEPFERATGMRVRHVTHVGLKLPAPLTEAIDRGARPPFDVVWSNAVPALRVAGGGGCRPLDETRVPRLAELSPRARPEGCDGWPVVSPYVVWYVLAYRESAFPAGPPESWTALLDPRLRGRIALYPGGNGFYPIAQVLGGGRVEDIPERMEPCWDFVKQLAPQIGELDYSIGMGELIRRGELDVCFRALTNAIHFRREGLDVEWTAPREGLTDTLDALWVPRGVPDDVAEWAQRYIDFALAPEVQESWAAHMGVMPVHPEASPPAELLARPGLPRGPDDRTGILHVPERIKVERELDWEARFQAIVGAVGRDAAG